jgi:hypothetical protein
MREDRRATRSSSHVSVPHFSVNNATNSGDQCSKKLLTTPSDSPKDVTLARSDHLPNMIGPGELVFTISASFWCVGTRARTTLTQITKQLCSCRPHLTCYRIITYVNAEPCAPRREKPRGGARSGEPCTTTCHSYVIPMSFLSRF